MRKNASAGEPLPRRVYTLSEWLTRAKTSGFAGYNAFFDASYDSMVRVWMTTEVSPFCQYCDWVVTTRVTLQLTIAIIAPRTIRPIKIPCFFIMKYSLIINH